MEKNAKVSIQYDAFVKAIRPDSKATESTVFLEGFIGESSLADHFRLYSDASLNDFVEIPTDAVVHSIANSKEESTLGGSKIWVKKDAIFTYGNPAMDNRPQGSFLDGDLYQGYMDNMYQADTSSGGGNMGAMGGGFENMASRPLCAPFPQTVLCPIASRIVICVTRICPSKLICPTRFCPTRLVCPTFGACPSIACQSIACNPGGGGRPFDANQGMADQFGGNFNPYFDGDLYQGYMDNMYQPQADASAMGAGQGDFMQQPQTIGVICGGTITSPVTVNAVICGGTITSPLTRFSPICPPRRTIIPVLCPTRTNFPPCNFPKTFPWSPICPRPISLAQICPTKPIICNFTGGNGPIQSIADCPSFPCPPGGIDPRVINPNPNIGGGIGGMNDQFGGDFNPYFDGDVNKAYMENMYQPQADAGMGNMGGAATIATNCGAGGVSIAACATFSVACQPSRLVICNEPSRFIRCNPVSLLTPCISQNRFSCITRRNDFICQLQLPTWWTKITTTFPDPRGPIFNPGDIRGGGGFGQMGDDFNGSFNPYGGF
jgi:hypothetical protein